MKITVKKFGGTSVATVDKIKAIANSLAQAEGKQVIVVSAMGKETDELIRLAQQVTSKENLREMDSLLSTGEIRTAALMVMALNSLGKKAISLNAAQLKLEASGFYSKGSINNYDSKILMEHLNDDYIVVVPGFQGINEKGEVITLGRGGSDTTAIALAAMIDADCEIYTDVRGIYRTNPKDYPAAKLIKKIDYDTMMEMAFLGSRVLEPRAAEIAKKYNVKLYVGQTLLPTSEGTYIMNKLDFIENRIISGLGTDSDISVFNLFSKEGDSEFVSQLFRFVGDKGVNIDMVTQSSRDGHTHLSFSFEKGQTKAVEAMLEEQKEFFKDTKIVIEDHLTKISLVGIGMATYTGFVGKVYSLLTENGIVVHNTTTSEISISFVIEVSKEKQAIEILAKEFDI